MRISASMAGESSGSPIALLDALRRSAIPVLLAVALAGCGEDSEPPGPAGAGARECADSWNAADGEVVAYVADIAEDGGDEAFVGSADGECVIYVENPSDSGEIYVFTARGRRWREPKRADVPELRRLDSNARILPGGRIELDR
jgi:hypothetical protein